MPIKPLNCKAYGSIGHLPESRLGSGDHCITDGQSCILTLKGRDKHDLIIVQEKLDGSCVAVANIAGNICALTRSGYFAIDSYYEQHLLFAEWVERQDFSFLIPGERVCGEWLALAHGTRYDLTNRSPFVAFDIFRGKERILYAEFCQYPLTLAPLLHIGNPLSVQDALTRLTTYGHYGAIDEAEGVVYRVERQGKVDFLGKFVKHNKVDGKYLFDENQSPLTELTWNYDRTTE